MQITDNFNSVTDNMHCPCCNAFIYDESFIRLVQSLRWIVGKAFVLDKRGGGFYRCRDYQTKNHPNHPGSMHCLGRAIDVSTVGWSGADKAKLIKHALSFDLSVGEYPNFIHLDNRGGDQVWFRG